MHRENPTSEIHVVVRERFAGALEGIGIPIVVHQLKTKEILSPIVLSDDLETAQSTLDTMIDELHRQEFDQIVNLSFSPLSSYFVDGVKSEHSNVKGYCRQTDGFLAIPDD